MRLSNLKVAVQTSRGSALLLDPKQGAFRRFNARGASPTEVARDFVMPSSYRELIDTTDAQLLIGPRGIGKTTLLKMLMPEALDAWRSTDAAVARDRIRFTGVFLQADRIWSGQLEQLSAAIDPGHTDETLGAAYTYRQRFATAAFAFLAFAALAEAAAYRCRSGGDEKSFRWVPISRAQEEALVGEIAPAFLAHPATASFAGLARQMRHNLSMLAQLMNTAGRPGVSAQELSRLMGDRLLKVHFYTAAIEFIDTFNHLAGDRWAPWVLLVNEFEFLPPGARSQIGRAFQGGDPRLSYKVSLAPYTGTSAFFGTEMNDWHKVELTHQSTDDFTKQLFAREFEKIGRPEKLLRGRGFDGPRKDTFGRTTRNGSDIRRLSELDESFGRWLSKTLDGRTPEALSDTDSRLRTLRKAMPLVRLRLEHHDLIETIETGRTPRPRVPEMYGGLKNIYLLTEGNPRWIKALSYELRKEYGKRATISEARQAEAISYVARVLYDNLRAVSIQQRSGSERDGASVVVADALERSMTPYGVLTTLGEFLQIHTHEKPFSGNVPGVFRIDELDEWREDVLNSLIFLGALVVEPRSRGSRYVRVRLARMWAPLFELLLSKGQPRLLSKALEHKHRPRHSLLREPDLLDNEDASAEAEELARGNADSARA